MKFKLGGKDGSGDATVPEPSGAAVVEKAKLKATFRMKGFAHAESYNNKHVQDNTIYCIGRIVQEAKPIKDLPQKGNKCAPTDSDASSETPASSSPPPSTPPADMQTGIA